MPPLLGLHGAHGAAVYQLIKTSPLQRQTSANPRLQKKGDATAEPKTLPCSGYFSPRCNSTCDWQQGHNDLTVRHSGAGICCRGLQSPGPPLRRHSHLALLILSIPLHDSGDPVHITRLSRDHSPRCLSITYNIITVISVPSSSAGRERIQLDGRRERRTGHSSRSPFSPHFQSLHVFIKPSGILAGIFSWQQRSK